MKVLYFAAIRQQIGVGQEDVSPPDDVLTVADLVAWLADRSEIHKSALCGRRPLRAAIDLQHADMNASIKGATEVAFFPPVTGG